MVLLQLMLRKFRPHPVKESCRRDNQIHDRLPTEQGIKFRTDSDRCIYVQMGSARWDVRVWFQRELHTHYPTTVTCSENRPKAGINVHEIPYFFQKYIIFLLYLTYLLP